MAGIVGLERRLGERLPCRRRLHFDQAVARIDPQHAIQAVRIVGKCIAYR